MRVLAGLRSVMVMASRAHLQAPATNFVRPFLRARRDHQVTQARAILVSPSPADSGMTKVNIFADFVVYKSKGAVALKVIKPTWSRISKGPGISVSREGTLLLEFANAVSERNYDWDNKGTFGLSALECAEVLEALEAGREKSFFHDPSKGSSDEGQVTKSLKLTPIKDSQGYFLNLAISDKAHKDAKYSTMMSMAEARVMRRLMDFAIPRLLGFDEIFEGPPEIRDSPEAGGAAPF